MPKRPSKPDINQLAASIVKQTTNGQMPKNPTAVALGRLGIEGGSGESRKTVRTAQERDRQQSDDVALEEKRTELSSEEFRRKYFL